MPSLTVATPISPTTSHTNLLNNLHNHETMIRVLSPSLITHSFVSGDPSSSAVYSVTDKKPIGQTTYKLTLTNTADGVVSFVEANPPVGTLTIKGRWTLEPSGGEGNGVLREEVDITANMIMGKMAKGNVEKTHPGFHVALMDMAVKA